MTTSSLRALLLALSVLLGLPLAAQEAGTVKIPEPVVPVYSQLKPLHLNTPLVEGGKATIALVAPAAYREQAEALQRVIRRLAGVEPPLVDEAAVTLPFATHLLCLGNRSTNRAIGLLYDRGYTFLDLKYPGPGGYVVNSLHSPCGDGKNVLFVGGSDLEGVRAGTAVLIGLLEKAGGGPGRLSVGWLQAIKLGAGYQVEHDVKKTDIWEASRMYGSSGYFGWNMLSKHLALYYQTGDESHLREFLRLAFPDAAAIKEIEDYDGERIENKHSPLSGPYHYAAHMMILLWDLVEESPFFTDEQRLKITNAFAAQLPHRVVEGVYGRTEPPASLGDRHGDWAATSLYALGRYFQKDYPSPVWAHCTAAAAHFFSTLERTYWQAGYNDHLFWFTSYYDPLLDYLLLSGHPLKDAERSNLRQALTTQEVLFQGLPSDPGTNASSLSMLNKAAYLLGDGRWLWYREHCGVDTDRFRLGQSFWPGPDLKPAAPTDRVNRWTLQPMPEPMWKSRATGLPLEQSLKWGSFRSSLDDTGDYIMLDGFNGGGRNPYHTFDLLTLRLAGAMLLDGYHNQVLTSADSMVEPQVAMDGALRYADVVGSVALAVSAVPKMAFCEWQRTLLQRVGRYALIVDDLAFRTASDNMKVETEWQPRGGTWDAARQAVRWRVTSAESTPPGWLSLPALQADCACGPGTAPELLSRLESLGIVLLKAPGVGAYVEQPFTLDQPVQGVVYVDLMNYTDRGIVQASLDGQPVGEPVDLYATGIATTRLPLGEQQLAAGPHTVRVTVVGKRAESSKHFVGLLGVRVRPPGTPAAAPPVTVELRPGEPVAVTGSPLVMAWRGASQPGAHRRFFYLLAKNDTGRQDAVACYQVADNAAVVQLPEPGLAVIGQYEGLDGDCVLLSERNLCGCGVRRVGRDVALLAADQPVAVDWDFEAGTLSVLTTQETKLTLGLTAGADLKLDGKLAAGGSVTLSTGRHELNGARPSTAALKPLVGTLPGALAAAREQYAARLKALGQEPPLQAPELASAFTGNVAGKPSASAVVNGTNGPLLAVAVGKAISLLGLDGKLVRTLTAEGDIRVLHWWPEPKLLLAGCADEQVLAFDEAGQRRWSFTSEMDKAVWEAGKQYWFKAAHPGIYGLGTGDLGSGPLCFVGSACTLEFLDPAGKLVKRTPVFWGPGRQFLVTDKPGGGKQLLQARWHNDGVYMAILDGQTLTQTGQGFVDVPAGHTYVTGWDCMNREDNFYADLEGDGSKEVVSAINGTWNRVTIWDASGRPLANAQFGPGTTEPRSNLRQMDLGDLNGDGKLELAVATAQGLVVVLDGKAQKLWACHLPSPPQVLRVVRDAAGKAELIVGCENGLVLTLDGAGQVVRQGRLSGKPAAIQVLPGAAGETAVIVSDTGAVAGFAGGK